jgi:hypothetical protein
MLADGAVAGSILQWLFVHVPDFGATVDPVLPSNA